MHNHTHIDPHVCSKYAHPSMCHDGDVSLAIQHVPNETNPVQDNDLCHNYTCCGITLHDLHALIEHFESCHIEILLSLYNTNTVSPVSSQSGSTPALWRSASPHPQLLHGTPALHHVPTNSHAWMCPR